MKIYLAAINGSNTKAIKLVRRIKNKLKISQLFSYYDLKKESRDFNCFKEIAK